jgi:hypothetical protein
VDTNGNAFSDSYLGPSAYSRLAELAAANPAVRLGVDQALEDPVALAAALSGSIYGVRSTANGLRGLAELPISTAEFLYTVAQEPEEFVVALGKAASVAGQLASKPAILGDVVQSLDDPVIGTSGFRTRSVRGSTTRRSRVGGTADI